MAARASRIRLLAASAALATAWLAAPHAVPLYDGLGVPDEPYRYVTPPAGYQQTPPPSSVSFELPAAGGTNTGGVLAQTKEQTSQAGVFIVPKALSGPAATKTFKITITAEAPDGPTPEGAIDGNMYKVQLWADNSPTATLTAVGKGSMPYIQRATSAAIPAASLLYRPPGGTWTTIPDTRGGTDSFQGYFAGAGDYALVQTKAPVTKSSHTLVIVVLVLVVLAMAGAVVLIRLSRRAPAKK
ncbi:MAG: hypothetical protein QOE24_2322 [Frankiales bacterium]|nr:hypothetical protein [Frankiales bacterium]